MRHTSLSGISGDGLMFFTNYTSRKARHLEHNRHAAMVFHWKPLERQVRFEGSDVPRPDFWGGYRLVPDRAEFWTGMPNRFHDRVEYRRSGKGWKWSRLQP